jgi:hypothetical protein
MCYIIPDKAAEMERRPCDCRREDFDCDVDFTVQSDGTCKLNAGKTARALDCTNGYYQYSTGYIKRAGNMCKGGKDLDVGTLYSCGPSKGLGFFGWFFIILASIAIVMGGLSVYRNFGHLFSRGGRIRFLF